MAGGRAHVRRGGPRWRPDKSRRQVPRRPGPLRGFPGCQGAKRHSIAVAWAGPTRGRGRPDEFRTPVGRLPGRGRSARAIKAEADPNDQRIQFWKAATERPPPPHRTGGHLGTSRNTQTRSPHDRAGALRHALGAAGDQRQRLSCRYARRSWRERRRDSADGRSGRNVAGHRRPSAATVGRPRPAGGGSASACGVPGHPRRTRGAARTARGPSRHQRRAGTAHPTGGPGHPGHPQRHPETPTAPCGPSGRAGGLGGPGRRH